MESDAHLSPMVPSDRPEAYPADLEQWVVLEDGTRVFVRPMVPDDVSRIAHAFEVADIDTIRRRFFTGAPPTDRTHLEYLANVDFVRRLALLAMDEHGDSIGVGRYEAIDDSTAEVAIVVEPDWRRRRVGTKLLELLEPPAVRQGFTEFLALFLPSNAAVEERRVELGYGDRQFEDGVVTLRKPLA